MGEKNLDKTEKMGFVHLLGHSSYSFLEAIGSIDAVLARAGELGQDAVALEEYFGMSGCVEFFQKSEKAGIKPLIGVTLGFSLGEQVVGRKQEISTISLLAQNLVGYKNLLKLTTKAMNSGGEKPLVTLDQCREFGEWNFLILGGQTSWRWSALAQREKPEKLLELLEIFKNVFAGVVLVVPAQDFAAREEWRPLVDEALGIFEKFGGEVVLGNDFHHPLPENRRAREAAMAIKDGKKMFDEDRRRPVGEFHLMSADEVREISLKNGFAAEQVDARMEKSGEIAARCEVKIPLWDLHFPNYDSPADIQELREKYGEKVQAAE